MAGTGAAGWWSRRGSVARDRGIGSVAVVLGEVLLEEVGVLVLLILDRVDDGAVIDDAAAKVEDGVRIEARVLGKRSAGAKFERVGVVETGPMILGPAQHIRDEGNRAAPLSPAWLWRRARSKYLSKVRPPFFSGCTVSKPIGLVGDGEVLVVDAVGKGQGRSDLPVVDDVDLCLVVAVVALGARGGGSGLPLVS